MTEIELCIMWAHRAQSVAKEPQVVRFYELCETALRAQQEMPNEPLTGPLKIGDSFHGMKIIGLDALARTITFSGWEPFHRKPGQEKKEQIYD